MIVIIDTNLWISFLIGKKLSVMRNLLTNPKVTIYVCNELLDEFADVSSSLSFAETVFADFILTGDKDLLALKTHKQTKIVTYREFETSHSDF